MKRAIQAQESDYEPSPTDKSPKMMCRAKFERRARIPSVPDRARAEDAALDRSTGGVERDGGFHPGADYSVDFGQQRGQTLRQIDEGGDRLYVEWIARGGHSRGVFVRQAAKAYLRYIGRLGGGHDHRTINVR